MSSQCEQRIRIDFISINYTSDCDFGDTGGMDPKLEIFSFPATQLIYSSHYSDLSHVTGAMDSVLIDDTMSDNLCPNWDTGFTIGTYDYTVESIVVFVDIYEKDSNALNDECSGFNQLFDRDRSTGQHTFDLTSPVGTIDVGGCMSYNYTITKFYNGAVRVDENRTLCPDDTLYINGIAYHQGNSTDQTTVFKNPDACDTIFTIDLKFFDVEPLSIISSDTLCRGATQPLSTSFAYDAYEWSTGEMTRSIEVDDAGTFSVTVTSANGCQQESSFNTNPVVLNPPNVFGPTEICPMSFADLEVQDVFESVVWSTTETTPLITINEGQLYQVTVTDINGCTSSTSFNVTELAPPVPELATSPFLCPGETLTLETTESYLTYSWSTTSSDPSIEVTMPGTYSITVFDSQGCIGSNDFIIEEGAALTATIIGPTAICNGETITLSLSDTYESYEWSTGDSTQEIQLNAGGDFNVTVTDADGCTGEAAYTVLESTALSATIEGELELCENETTVLSETTPLMDHMWSDGSTNASLIVSEGGIYTVTITDSNGCTNTSSAEVIVSVPQIFMQDSVTCYPDDVGIIETAIEGLNGCDDLLVTSIILDEEAACDINLNYIVHDETCPGAGDAFLELQIEETSWPVTYGIITEDNSFSYLGLIPDAQFIDTIPLPGPGEYLIGLGTDAGYLLDVNVTVEVGVLDDIQLDDLTISAGQSVELIADLDPTLYSEYYWSENSSSLCPGNCDKLEVNPDSTTTYYFFNIQSETGCEEISNLTVFVLPDTELYVPDIFNPSIQGEDGVFAIQGPGASFLKRMEVYDRWGNVVYTSTSSQIGWNGRKGNQPLDQGVYVYVLELDTPEGSKIIHGSVALIK